MTSNDLLTLEILRLRERLERYEKDCGECENGVKLKFNEMKNGEYHHIPVPDGKCPHCTNGKVPVVRVPGWFVKYLKRHIQNTWVENDSLCLQDRKNVEVIHTLTRDPADPDWWVMEETK